MQTIYKSLLIMLAEVSIAQRHSHSQNSDCKQGPYEGTKEYSGFIYQSPPRWHSTMVKMLLLLSGPLEDFGVR